MKLAKTSVAVLVIQLALVSTIAVKYLHQRRSCPRVWVRTAAYDPDMVMRGRYLSTQLLVDGCKSTLPSAKQAQFPRNVDGTTKPGGFGLVVEFPVYFRAYLKVENNRLIAVRVEGEDRGGNGQQVIVRPGSTCDQMRLAEPVDFYIAEHAASPLPVKAGQELWVEVTIPPKGPPRPIQMALKDNGAWKPLTYR